MSTVGSLCSGYGGLDLAVESVFGARTVWHAENDPAPSKVLAARWPGVPNLGDLTAVDWPGVEPVDLMTAGYPCQPFSHAGQRKGTDDERHLWPYVAEAIRGVRPRLVVLENVAGHRSMGFDAVVGDLAALGYDARWTSLRAADIGAPHGRERVFVLAVDARHEAGGSERRQQPGVSPLGAGQSGVLAAPDAESEHGRPGRATPGRPSWAHDQLAGRDSAAVAYADDDAAWNGCEPGHPSGSRAESAQRSNAAPDAERGGRDGRAPDQERGPLGGIAAAGSGADLAADAASARRSRAEDIRADRGDARADRRGCVESERGGRALADTTGRGRSDEPISGNAAGQHERPVTRAGSGDSAGSLAAGVRDVGRAAELVAWGPYEPAVRRWERQLGRLAPAPTEPGTRGGQRLSPRFVEWMMGLPAGWVTDVDGLGRNDQLKILGNGVVPQQAEHALRTMLAMSAAA